MFGDAEVFGVIKEVILFPAGNVCFWNLPNCQQSPPLGDADLFGGEVVWVVWFVGRGRDGRGGLCGRGGHGVILFWL